MADHIFPTQVIEFGKSNRYDSPIVIGGFVGPGLAGIVAASYIVEQLGLHEIGHVRSQHIPPVAVFIGEKLRHPFRMYKDDPGRTVVVMCEVPIDLEGLYEISAVLLNWFEQIRAKEIIILDAIPVGGIPEAHDSLFVAQEGRVEALKKKGVGSAQSAMIGGVGGSILSECLSRRLEGVSLLTQASVNLPDPGASLTLIKSLNTVYGMDIATKVLEANVEELNAQLNQLGEQYQKLQDLQRQQSENSVQKAKSMYS